MGIFGWSYPPGAANDPYAPYNQTEQPIDITAQLREMGKKGHGLCGKDADLDYGGQIKVEGCFLLEKSIEARLHVYATICEPCEKDDESEADYEARREAYGELVSTWFHPAGVSGEWSGDDWCFCLTNNEHHYKITIPFKWWDSRSEKQNIDRAVRTIYKAIWKDQGVKDFQENMTELAKAG